ncbi:Sugar phosphate isomerase/epimerase [Pustulibacterium marinum]|uniref:Sugar phosphate isomerase/epimerase n=1 Tax=Pustulibacterium marinum TaxID=1224947 RepID=A0A1I7I7T2_9FLAO|nr:TIM barrel protein [Pustulibacterium marinum]SFU68998.1 Sugar phosphate isomerase/epimerase [Pustulibacterium marinum]
MKRRKFIRNSAQAGLAFTLLGIASCVDMKPKKEVTTPTDNADEEKPKEPFFKLSLAQWSIHRMIMEQGMNPLDFAEKAHNWGFEGLEYVNHLYAKELEKNTNSMMALDNLVKELLKRSDANNMNNLIIMVDGEGDLASNNKKDRNTGVENHHKWVDAAAALGCHSIRVNLFGAEDREEWKNNSIDALSKLSEYAKGHKINVLVENHGYLSSDAQLLTDVMKGVNMDNCGTLPDFGNFCLKRENNERWGAPCVEEYDRYKGVKELMPFAKAVSAKTYDFDDAGNETIMDYTQLLQIVKDHGYNGYIGVEYEGDRLSEEEGLIATKNLLLKSAKEVS